MAAAAELLRERALPANKPTGSPVPLRKVLVAVPIRVSHETATTCFSTSCTPGPRSQLTSLTSGLKYRRQKCSKKAARWSPPLPAPYPREGVAPSLLSVHSQLHRSPPPPPPPPPPP
eukprot:COSAG04_NODE_8046_length_1030_cov_1.627282_1_plen_116_part_10